MRKVLTKDFFIGLGVAIVLVSVIYFCFQVVAWKKAVDTELIITQSYLSFLDRAAKIDKYDEQRFAIINPEMYAASKAASTEKAKSEQKPVGPPPEQKAPDKPEEK